MMQAALKIQELLVTKDIEFLSCFKDMIYISKYLWIGSVMYIKCLI